jgi:RNA polymerase sigma-70 factor (ECF subfamily)
VNGEDDTDRRPDQGRRHLTTPHCVPLEFEAYYLVHQEFFRLYAQIRLADRAAADAVLRETFLEILDGWEGLLREGDLEQRAFTLLERRVQRPAEPSGNLHMRTEDKSTIESISTIRQRLGLTGDIDSLYEALGDLSAYQFSVVVMRYCLGYPTERVARSLGLDELTVCYHVRAARKRLAARLHIRTTGTAHRFGTQ